VKEIPKISVLFTQPYSIYRQMGLDCWDEKRDARKYDGPRPVIAHPPCNRWGPLAFVNQARYGTKIGTDNGLFKYGLLTVRRCGGVLEHPAKTMAWPKFGLRKPRRGLWLMTLCGGWVTEVSQGNYGHRSQKLTWLYVTGCDKPFDLDWSLKPGVCSVEWLPKKERSATPRAFAKLLIRLALLCNGKLGQ
jgi:hypothetical protein